MYDYSRARRYLQSIGLSANNWNSTVMVAAALERGIEVSRHETLPRLHFDYEGKHHFWQRGNSRLNGRLAYKCARLKNVSSRLLRSRGISSPENTVFSSSEHRRAWAWAQPISPVVIKPFGGRQGKDVYVNISDRKEFEKIFDRLANSYEDLLVEKFAEGDDYRVTVVDGFPVAATKRTAAHVVGDGTTNIQDLVVQKNENRGVLHKKLRLNQLAIENLDKQGHTPRTTPNAGQAVFLRGTANHSTGGDITDATDSLRNEELQEIKSAVRAIPGLRLVGVDILLSRSETGDQLNVIELNASPNIAPHHFPLHGQPRDAAGAVLDAMFPESSSTHST